jgi:hypothetical protein
MTLNPKLDPSCVLCLPFGEESGSTAYDQSLYGNHGTIYGATRVLGKIGKALSFDGIDDYGAVPISPLFNMYGKSYSVLFWLYTLDITTSWQGLVTPSAWSCFPYIHLHPNRIYAYEAKADGTYVTLWSHALLPYLSLNTWYHVAVVRDLSVNTYYLYVNAKLGDYEVNTAPDRNLNISLNMGYMPFKGLLDEVRVYNNRALSAKEILEHYVYGVQNLRRPRFPEFRKELRRELWPAAVV